MHNFWNNKVTKTQEINKTLLGIQICGEIIIYLIETIKRITHLLCLL